MIHVASRESCDSFFGLELSKRELELIFDFSWAILLYVDGVRLLNAVRRCLAVVASD